MNISDRIQHLRKAKGLSQEDLADKIGVSRQSVSKWESEQSAPDIEKIILMSDFFDVTTDFLLKGIEPARSNPDRAKEKPNAHIFSIAATAFNFLGLIVAAMVWYEEQNAVAAAIGLIFMVMGCMIYAVGITVSDAGTKPSAKKRFWSINVWLLTFIPLTLLHSGLTGEAGAAPYLIFHSPFKAFVLFWIFYLTIGITADILICKFKNK